MPRPPDPLSCEVALGWLDALPDGELTAAEEAALATHADACPACAAELALARDLAQACAALPRLTCPPEITRAVLEVVAREAGTSRWRRFFARPASSDRRAPWGSWLQPALGLAFAAALAAALVYRAYETPPAIPLAEPVSPQQAAKAEHDLKLAFAYLGKVGREAGTLVRNEMVENVVAPTQRAIGR